MKESFKTQVTLSARLSEEQLKSLGMNSSDNYDIITENVSISWDLYIDMRNWGVKTALAIVPDQEFTIHINVWSEGGEDVVKELKVFAKKVETSVSCDFPMCPSNFEMYDGRFTLEF